MSKKRFADIGAMIIDILKKHGLKQEDCQAIQHEMMKSIEEIMKFSPTASKYTKDEGKKKAEYYKERRRKERIANAIQLLKDTDEKDL